MGIKVAIDAGHGSNTAGKRTPDGYREHWINVMCAYSCEQYLKKYGIECVRIGWDDEIATDDPDVALSARQKAVKAAGCDYSISFHANAFRSGYNSANGVETLYHSNANVRGDSINLAQAVQRRMIQGTNQTDRKIKPQALSMCNCSAMGTKASVLTEVGFMTNEREADLMKTAAFCKEQGEDAAKGFLDYLKVPIGYYYNNLDYGVVFDPVYYSDKYVDLKKAFGNDSAKLFNHFCTYGMKEGRKAIGTFNVQIYKNRYPDLQKAFGDNLPAYYKHYITYGKNEGRCAV